MKVMGGIEDGDKIRCGGGREQLADRIPLEMPYALYISPAHICNFKCFYCLQGKTAQEKKDLGILPRLMDMDTARKIATCAAEFPGKLKRLMFSGCGEPLTHPEFPEIVRQFSSRDVSQKYELNTNAALLTPELSDRMIEAGINGIRISIQGLSAAKYKEVCGVSLDYDCFMDNLKYLYEHKKDCSIYIKIIDSCLEPTEKDEDFYRLFGDVCDRMYVEHFIQAQPNMEDVYGRKHIQNDKTIHGKETVKQTVCPLMFYQMQVDAAGNVFPCCVVGLSESFALGNVQKESLTHIWGNHKHQKLWLDGLSRQLDEWEICKKCNAYVSITQKEDRVDDADEAIRERILKWERKRTG